MRPVKKKIFPVEETMFVRNVLMGLFISIVPFGVFGQTPNGPATPAESLKVVQNDLGLSDSQFGKIKE